MKLNEYTESELKKMLLTFSKELMENKDALVDVKPENFIQLQAKCKVLKDMVKSIYHQLIVLNPSNKELLN